MARAGYFVEDDKEDNEREFRDEAIKESITTAASICLQTKTALPREEMMEEMRHDRQNLTRVL